MSAQEQAASDVQWEALSTHSKSTSRFVSRVASTQIHARGAPLLTSKDLPMMASIERISAEVKQEAKIQGVSPEVLLTKKMAAGTVPANAGRPPALQRRQ